MLQSTIKIGVVNVLLLTIIELLKITINFILLLTIF